MALRDGDVFGGAYLGQIALGYGDVGPLAQRWYIDRPLRFWGEIVVDVALGRRRFGSGAYLGQIALGYGDVGPLAQRWYIDRPLCFWGEIVVDVALSRRRFGISWSIASCKTSNARRTVISKRWAEGPASS